MPYVSKVYLRRALEQLAAQHPIVVFSLPAMTRAKIPSAASQADADQGSSDRYGGAQEKQLLETFYRVPGDQTGGPYYSPSAQDFVSERYAETSLQRQRKDLAKPTERQIFFETGGRGDRGYAIAADVATRIAGDKALLPRGPLPLVALGAWMFRDTPVNSVQELVDLVKNELELNRDGLLGPVYDDSTSRLPLDQALEDKPISPEALLDLLDAPPPPPPPPTLGTVDELVERIEQAILASGSFSLAEGLVGRVVRAWLNRDIAVLVGAPGTGKSSFAREFARACESQVPEQGETFTVNVDPDYDDARLLGYLDLGGTFRPSDFTERILRTSKPLVPRVVIFEEWNVAQVETYLSQILHAVEGEGAVQLADNSEPRLPIDALLLATCNSVRDEPETRRPMSRPTKRRATIIEMPNVLLDAYVKNGRPALIEEADHALAYERDNIEAREDAPPAFDELRAARLEAVASVNDLDEATREALLDLLEVLFTTEDGRELMTIGLLIDVLRDVIFAGEDSLAALGWQVTGKLLEQVTDFATARALAEACKDLPNAEAIQRAVKRMDLRDGSVAPLL